MTEAEQERARVVAAVGSPRKRRGGERYNRTLSQRLAGKSRHDSRGCILWHGATQPSGHGRIMVERKDKKVHRIAWEQKFGQIPDGLCVLHRCDVPNCINPDHLFLGTVADNNADMVRKGRQVKGEANSMAKLTTEKVVAARKDRMSGLSFEMLAAKYQVSFAAIHSAVTGKTWKHVDHLKGVE